MSGGRGQIVTFYSYKGGTGRSMALANVAWILASAGKRVLVIDWDLEAPGLQRYFRPFLIDKDLAASDGLVDFITDFILEAIRPVEQGEQLDKDWYVAQADLLRYAVSLEWDFPGGGALDFVPAGRQGPDYATRFAAIHWQNFYERLGGGGFFEAVKEQVRAAYDYVLIDSRTGVSDTAGICTIQMPDTLVVCFTFNNQSIDGAAAVARSAYDQRARASLPGPNDLRVVPVPMRVEVAESDRLEQRKRFARWRFGPFIQHVPTAERAAFWSSVEVPYIPYFAYEEILSPFREDARDPKTCLAAFVRIAAHITRGDVADYVSLVSPEERQEVLQVFAQTPAADDEATASPPTPPAETETPIERYLRLAELTCAGLGDGEREAARRLWTRLARVPRPEEGVEISKVRVHARDLGDVPAPVVEKFAAAGLLAVGRDEKTGQSTFESASEELLRSWKRLLGWIEEEREFLLWRQKLQAACATWEAKGRAPHELLEGRALDEAQEFAGEHRAELNEAEAAYLQASQEARRQKVRGYTKAAAAAAAAFLIVSLVVVLAVWAYFERRDNTQAAAALAEQAEELVRSARSRSTGEPIEALQTGLLLAVESQRLAPNAKAEGLLRKNLALLPRRVAVSDLGKNVLRVALSADGRRAVAVTERAAGPSIGPSPAQTARADNRAWQVIDVENSRASIAVNFPPGADYFALSPSGKHLAVVTARERDAMLSDAAPRVSEPRLVKAAAQTSQSKPSRPPAPAGPRLVYSVEVTDMESYPKAFTLTHEAPVNDIAFSPDGNFLATAGEDGVTQLLDLRTGKSETVAALRHAGGIEAVAFSGDGRTCANVGRSGWALFWRIPEPGLAPPPRNVIRLDRRAIDLRLNRTGDVCAFVSETGDEIRLFDTASGKVINNIGLARKVGTLAFDSSGRYLLTSDSDGRLNAWGVTYGGGGPGFADLFPGDENYNITFSPDGRFVGASSENRVARVWRAEAAGDSFPIVGLLAQGGNVNHLAFSLQGGLVATAGADNVVRVWNLDRALGADLTRDEPCARLRRNLTAEEWGKYFPNRPFQATCPEFVKLN